MGDVVTRPKARMTSEEIERRRRHVRVADSENRLEGIYRDSQSDVVFDAYIRGEIEATDIVPRLKALIPR